MSWTKDEERLLQHVSEYPEDIRCEEKESYWKTRERDVVGIAEYGFETFYEIQQYLTECTEDSQIALIAGAAAIKGKAHFHMDVENVEDITLKRLENIDIPEYVYTF